jgi:hypothetical protein
MMKPTGTRLASVLLPIAALAAACAMAGAAKAETGSITVPIPSGTLSYSITGSKQLTFENPTYVDPQVPATLGTGWQDQHEHAYICAEVFFGLDVAGYVSPASQRTGWYCKIIDFPNATSDQTADLAKNVMTGSFDLSELGADSYCHAWGECTPGVIEMPEAPLAPINLDRFVGQNIEGLLLISYCATLRWPDGGTGNFLGCNGTPTYFGRGAAALMLAGNSLVPPVRFRMTVKPSATDCHVPRLIGLKLATATKRLSASNCRLGRVGHAYSRKVPLRRVVGQGIRAGRWLPRNSRVGLVLSRGRKAR